MQNGDSIASDQSNENEEPAHETASSEVVNRSVRNPSVRETGNEQQSDSNEERDNVPDVISEHNNSDNNDVDSDSDP